VREAGGGREGDGIRSDTSLIDEVCTSIAFALDKDFCEISHVFAAYVIQALELGAIPIIVQINSSQINFLKSEPIFYLCYS
jgi:hypothetical protein